MTEHDLSQSNAPLVSVITPMYNSAKFIPQTLESLLYQTMTDFEVIVIDDCSTDNSVEVVESYAPKFESMGVKLNIIKLPKNTGTPGLPRNIGIQAARGKYIAFLDSDDLFTKTALEEMSGLGEEYQAEVVHMESYFDAWEKQKNLKDPDFFDWNDLLNSDLHVIRSVSNIPVLDKPTFDTKDIADRINRWLNCEYKWATCLIFARRDFLADNQIIFPKYVMAEDMLFTFSCLCLAEKFLRVPNITYIVRRRAGSVSCEDEDNLYIVPFIHKRLSSSMEGLIAFEEFMNKVPFLRENPAYRYKAKDFFFDPSVSYAWQIPLLYEEFHHDDADLTAYLFAMVNVYQNENSQLKKMIYRLQNYRIQAKKLQEEVRHLQEMIYKMNS